MDKNNCGKPQFSGEWVRLGELISKAKVARCGSADYPVLSMTMHDGIVEQSGRFKKAIASTDKSTYKVVNPGQLVVGFPIDEGVLYVQNCGYSGIMSPAYNVWNIDADKVLPSYLELALHSPQSMNYYVSKIRGTTARRRSMPAETLCELPISLPGHERQRNIVATLAHLKSQQDNAERQLALLDTLVKSRFNEMFEGVAAERQSLPSIVWFQEGPGVRNHQYASHGVKLLNVANLRDGKLDTSNTDRYISETEAFGRYRHFIVDAGDLIIASSGIKVEYFEQKMGFANKDQLPLCMNTSTIRFKPIDPSVIDMQYFMYYLKSDDFKRQLERNITGSAQLNFGPSHLKRMTIPVPSIMVQKQFSQFVRQVDKLRFDVQQQIDKLELFKNSLMQEYFG